MLERLRDLELFIVLILICLEQESNVQRVSTLDLF